LENQINRAVKVSVFREMFGSGQQHGGVPVVATCMHLARVFASMGKGVEFLHWQGVNVSPQTNASATSTAIAAMHNANHPRGAHAAVHRNAPVGQLLGHHIGCAHFLEAQFGVSMNVFSNGRNAGGFSEDGVDQFHDHSLPRLMKLRYNPLQVGGHLISGLSRPIPF